MNAIPLARFLVEFSAEGDVAPGRGAKAAEAAVRGNDETAARIADAMVRGRDEGRAAAEAEFQAKREAQQGHFEQQLASKRHEWVEQEGTVLAERMLAAIRDMESRISGSVAHILQPFLAAQVRGQAVSELAVVIEGMVSKDQGAALAVSGPDDLISVLQQKLAGTRANVTFSSSDTPEVQVVVDQTILQTRLDAWMARIAEAVA